MNRRKNPTQYKAARNTWVNPGDGPVTDPGWVWMESICCAAPGGDNICPQCRGNTPCGIIVQGKFLECAPGPCKDAPC